MKISVIFPVLNEENRLEIGILKTIEYFKHISYKINYEIIIVDNGSVDRTEELSKSILKKYNNIIYLKLKEKGVGLAFREGAKVSSGDIVGYMDIDISTDLNAMEITIREIVENNFDIVNSSRYLPNSKIIGRPLFRTITSKANIYLINRILKLTFTDYMCGFKFFKREVLMRLIELCSDEKGWFFCAELLIVGHYIGKTVKEIPVNWIDERSNSKVDSQIIKLSFNYLKNVLKLKSRYRNKDDISNYV
ncbi:glycosyltransferase, group 2 family protein [Peptoanaerobacter stomatis]|uniref:Glycosyltransferase, group 2 family protein n=1 Tax=Peptoanaerobacter stomatis TaxID=796937 RepID=J6HEW8_9FIRM|nr:glycosyltransferase [Peptoanaerobacter stomatis]EJU23565.1 glycosyltransferase, group 2 family protein [Peptoanaerobacter stomatis]NWO24571.1 glycosyltransferase [Peptostreptococcaceae bacterium oral taxon 081]